MLDKVVNDMTGVNHQHIISQGGHQEISMSNIKNLYKCVLES